MGLIGFQAIVTIVMVILAALGLVGYYSQKKKDK
jgi:hypothetical protein